ncbi:C6 transcription factor [Penicillium antarcticum]|uniref:C6 transcription factor n=1 Tax=Penicillium antarcticum TaxID=416450 RepID=UPI002398A5B8|nr:C6 transcription factor [Penicillium antarcticum]KAJ5306945.1 C6 transcription factor [Penicillium antarcticum]
MRSETAGCWTCRLRHLKCDLHAPACKECTDRHVHCHGYGPKPSWMDGASGEQKERQRIKAAINENFRRVKKLQGRARRRAREQSQALSESLMNAEAPRAMITPPQPPYSPCLSCQTDTSRQSIEPGINGTRQDTNEDHNEAPQSRTDSDDQNSEPWGGLDSREAYLLMHYLDQVFPWQFPYHCSRSRLGNRGWLFLLLIQRGPLYHAVLSLSSLHQAAILGTEEEFQQQQKAFEHHSRALRKLCDIMSEKGDQLLDDHPQLAEFLACSFMLISFEVFRGAEHDWLLHLDATASLMGLLSPEAIFNSDSTICDLSSIPFSEQYRSPKSGMVEGLQFLTVAVIWSDIFACVATGRAPRLPYQQWLRIQGLNTADLMGCENWVMVVIGDLAHLSIWKEKQEEEGMLSIRELASRGKEIERCLEGGIQDLDLARCVGLLFLMI